LSSYKSVRVKLDGNALVAQNYFIATFSAINITLNIPAAGEKINQIHINIGFMEGVDT
jgi:hypothetical protein